MPRLLTVEEYLEEERYSPVKREYVAGRLVTFVGANRRHNLMVSNLLRHFFSAAEGTKCQVFVSQMLIRVAIDLLYYPDISVVCDRGDLHQRYIERPCLVVEVVSPSTAARDRYE